jgi:malonate-semialdehyde dehydrogenase (acetylating)/methylmalonate-semialdehyde dehydrogenase
LTQNARDSVMLAERAGKLAVAAGNVDGAEMGPLITDEHRKRVAAYIQAGCGAGATIVLDGRQHPMASAPGYFLGATLFDHVIPEMSIYREDIFGPVLSTVRVSDFAAAIELVNGHEFGNGAPIFTSSGSTAREFVQRVEAGMVGVNVPIPVPMVFHSFGGWKHSLFGDHAVHGEEGIRFYTRLKTVTTRWFADACESAPQFEMPTHV